MAVMASVNIATWCLATPPLNEGSLGQLGPDLQTYCVQNPTLKGQQTVGCSEKILKKRAPKKFILLSLISLLYHSCTKPQNSPLIATV